MGNVPPRRHRTRTPAVAALPVRVVKPVKPPKSTA